MGLSKEALSKPATWARIGAVAGAITFLGCQENMNQKHPNTVQTSPAIQRLVSMQYPPDFQPSSSSDPLQTLLTHNYLELQNALPTLHDTEHITLPDSSTTTVYNFTQFGINSDALYNVYYYIDHYTHDFDPPLSFSTEINGKKRIITMLPSQDETRDMIIVPAGSPYPSWADEGGYDAITDGTFSIVYAGDTSQVSLFPTPAEEATSGIATEACQEMVEAQVFDTDGNVITDEKETLAGQEILCNSFGRFLAAGLLGKPYSEYCSQIQNHSWYFSTLDSSVDLIPLTENAYNDIATSGAILK